MKASLISSSFAVTAGVLKKTREFWAKEGVALERPRDVSRKKDLLCAHSLETRLLELRKAFGEDTDSQIVWALRGGYGLHELLPYLKASDFKAQKTFMAFSDGTSLHYYLNKSLNQPSLHSPHPNWFARDKNDKILKEINMLFKDPKAYSPVFKGLKKLNSTGSKNIKAKIIGGNMMTLQAFLGTSFDQGCRGDILFLEEVDEPAYKINRILRHMEQAGFFKGVKAVVFGHLSHSSKAQEKLISKIVKRWAEEQKFPVLSGFQAGHIHHKNHPFWFGKKSELIFGKRPRLLNNI